MYYVLIFIFRISLAGIVQSLYITPSYNMDLDITLMCCGSQLFLPWNFTRNYKENDHDCPFITRFIYITMDPKHSVIKGRPIPWALYMNYALYMHYALGLRHTVYRTENRQWGILQSTHS